MRFNDQGQIEADITFVFPVYKENEQHLMLSRDTKNIMMIEWRDDQASLYEAKKIYNNNRHFGLNDRCGDTGDTLLATACLHGNVEAVEFLVRMGADVLLIFVYCGVEGHVPVSDYGDCNSVCYNLWWRCLLGLGAGYEKSIPGAKLVAAMDFIFVIFYNVYGFSSNVCS